MWITMADLIRQGVYDSEHTIRRMCHARRFPPPTKIGGKLKWKQAVVDKWLAAGSIVWIPRRQKEAA